MLHVQSITSSDLRLLRITITWSDAGLIPSEAARAWGVDIVTHKTLLLKFVISLATDSRWMNSVLHPKRSENARFGRARPAHQPDLPPHRHPTLPHPHLLPRALQDKSISSRNDSLFLDKAPRARYGRRHGGREDAKRLLAAFKFGVEKYESEFD